jgi:Type IV secretion-system coupling protein DNA-binding domain
VIRLYLILAALRLAGRVALVLAGFTLALAAAPVSLVAASALAAAWLAGWPPARLYRAALWCLPMLAVWLAATALASGSWTRVAAAPYLAWLAMWHAAATGAVAQAAVTIAPVAVPLGLLAGGLAWSRRMYAMRTGAGGLSPTAPVAFDQRQWRHQVRAARARIAAPGAVPLLSRSGEVVTGAVIRTAGHRAAVLATLPYQRLRSHQVVIGTTGTGKTTLLLRLWAGFLARGLQRHGAGNGGRPLLVVLDCKGGADSRRVADRARRVLREAGARSTAVWPDEARLSLWALPPPQLTTTLVDLIEHGSGSAAYYADVMEAVVALAVGAPAGPPASTADFLARLEAGWLAAAYPAGHAGDAALLRSAAGHIGDIALRFRTLFRRLGVGLDGPGGFADADAWYCIVEGTSEIAVAEAQARALVDLLASFATHGPGQDRDILLAVDEFSAVSRRVPIWQLYERARSLGLAVQVSAQSWQGLAAREDERYRIAATADGGIWLLRTPHPEPVTGLAGSRPAADTARRVLRVPVWHRDGVSRMRQAPVADPAIVRSLGVGQAAYIYRGGVTFVQVKRLIAAPAAVTGTMAGRGRPPGPVPAGASQQAGAAQPAGPGAGGEPARLPDAGPLLDEAFGGEQG